LIKQAAKISAEKMQQLFDAVRQQSKIYPPIRAGQPAKSLNF